MFEDTPSEPEDGFDRYRLLDAAAGRWAWWSYLAAEDSDEAIERFSRAAAYALKVNLRTLGNLFPREPA
jgi:hypothetical protein